MSQRNREKKIILSADTANGVGNDFLVTDYQNIVISLDATVGAGEAVTIKVQGSLADSDNVPDFSASQSATNQWDYVQVIDLEDGTTINGDTGITITGADDNRQIEINVNGLNWVNLELSSITGTIAVTAVAQAYSNN